MDDPEKLTTLKKAYADIILNTAKEAAARVMITENKARGYQLELEAVRDEALSTCLRLKQMYDSKVKEAEMMSLKKQQEIEELQAQLGEAEDIVGELRVELYKARYLLEKLANGCQTNEEKKPDEAVSLEVREDSTNHEGLLITNGIKPDMNDRDIGINRCSYKESKEPRLFTLPSILSRRRVAEAVERNGDCADVEALTEASKEEEKENDFELSFTAVSPSMLISRQREADEVERNGDCVLVESLTEASKEEEEQHDIELSTTAVSPSEKPCIRFKYTRKRKKDGRSFSSSSPEGGDSSSQDDEESKKKRQKTCEKDNVYLDSFNSTKPSRDSQRVAQVACQLLNFTEKKVLQQSQCEDLALTYK